VDLAQMRGLFYVLGTGVVLALACLAYQARPWAQRS
jgi:hypothetical protein